MGEGTTALIRPLLALPIHHELSHLCVSVPWRQALCWWGRLPTMGREMDLAPALTWGGGVDLCRKTVAEQAKSRRVSSVTALSLPPERQASWEWSEMCSETLQSWALTVGPTTRLSTSLRCCPCLRKDLLWPL